ncbi:hypothetical protein JCM10207_008609 [Rhodosporidiobolus poonsookiae]
MPSIAPAAPADEPQFVTYTAGATVHKRPVLRGAAMKPTFSSIPDVDCSNLLSNSLDERRALASEIGKALREVGFFYAHNPPGVTREAMDGVFEGMAEFFSLPVEEKLKVHTHKSTAARGYEPLMETQADKSTKGDAKESFIIGEDPLDPDHAWIGKDPEEGDGPMNIWPAGQDRFRQAFQRYYKESYRFAQALLRVYALALGLDELALDKYFEFPTANANCLHYPPQDAGDKEIVGLAAHCDYSLFTLVLQQGVEGIQVLNDNGHWVPGPPKKYTYLVNVGDYLQILTNGIFRSTVHRVINSSGSERYSLPMFFSPDWRCTIAPIGDLLKEGEEPKYEGVAVESMHVHRIFATRFKHPTAALIKEKGLKFENLRYSMLKGRFS